MDNRPVIIGTVRAIQEDRAIVRCPDGRGFMFHLLPGQRPALGEDVVGRVDVAPDGTRTLDLSVPFDSKTMSASVDATIAFFGDARIAARLLRRLSSGTAAYSPGHGDTIRRTHRTGDRDLDWALDAFEPESAREQVTLNILDVRALASSPWAKEDLADLLPSDTCADPASADALIDCLRSGFSPTTRMILEPSMDQESVDFILPFCPISGGWDFVRREAGVARREWPLQAIPASAARRLSSARQMALSFASKLLPTTSARLDDDLGRAAWRRRLANSFADAAAALAWRRSGGDPKIMEIWASAKTASATALAESTSPDQRATILSGLTSDAIRSTVNDGGQPLLREAAAIALASCAAPEDPENRIRMLELAANGRSVKRAMFIDCDAAHPDVKAERQSAWLADLADVMTHLGSEHLALDRLAHIGRSAVPMGFQRLFDLEMEAIDVDSHMAMAAEDGIEIEQFSPAP